MYVVGFDPRPEDPELDGHFKFVERVDLKELFRCSDIVTLHCGLNESSRGMINRDLLATVKPGSILINASRGGLIAGDDVLVEALDRGWLSAIGLDVFATEPPEPGSRLLQDQRVVASPHAIGLTRAWNERVFTSLADDVRQVLAGQQPRYLANPEAMRAPAPSGPAN